MPVLSIKRKAFSLLLFRIMLPVVVLYMLIIKLKKFTSILSLSSFSKVML